MKGALQRTENRDRPRVLRSFFAKHCDFVFIGLVLAAVPAFAAGSNYYMRLATLALVYMAWTVAFNLIFGHTKQLFLCVGALAGSAAYMTVVLTKQLHLSPWLAVPLGLPFGDQAS